MTFNDLDLDHFPRVSGECFHCHDYEGETRLICGRVQHVDCFQKDAQKGYGLQGNNVTSGIIHPERSDPGRRSLRRA